MSFRTPTIPAPPASSAADDGLAPWPPSASITETVNIVFPTDTNPHGTIFGGKVMRWVDQVAAMAAQRHCRRVVVTVSMDALIFKAPIFLGEYAIVRGVVNRAWKSSMEVQVTVDAEHPLSGEHRAAAEAFLTFVALDEQHKPVPIRPIAPETPEEWARYAAADARRRARLASRGAGAGPGPAESVRTDSGRSGAAGLEALAPAERDRIRAEHLARGVTMIDPGSTWIDPAVVIGPGTVLWPDTYLLGRTVVGAGCTLGPGTLLRDAEIGDGVVVTLSVVESAEIGPGSDVGPFAHLRAGARIGANVHIGNFGEIKNARLAPGVRMGHFGYIGDAEIGADSNIGAGTVTCNFDGTAKHATHIGREVLIGSDTLLVAPVTVGDGARTGAGSVVTADVAPGATVAGVPARPLRRRDDKTAAGDDAAS
jgi:acyl-CoA hydrolase/acetyltransferase-like isoleucine patch superfamily enzyme